MCRVYGTLNPTHSLFTVAIRMSVLHSCRVPLYNESTVKRVFCAVGELYEGFLAILERIISSPKRVGYSYRRFDFWKPRLSILDSVGVSLLTT